MQSSNQNYGALPPGQAGMMPGGQPGAPPAGYQQPTYQGGGPAGHTNTAYSGYPQPGGQPPPQPGGQPFPQPAGQAYPQPGYPGNYQPPQGPQQAGMPAGMAPPQPDGEIVSQYKGPVPDADVEDNPNAAAPLPSAPPLDKMDNISGYQNTGFSAGHNPNAAALLPSSSPLDKMDNISGYQNTGFSAVVSPPPSYDEAMAQEPPNRGEIPKTISISDEEARAVLLEYVSQFCCYGKGAANDMKITDIKSTSAFHYTLESYCEGRSTEWAYEAYTGQPIDGPQNGVPPGPWDIQAQLPELFKDSKMEVEVPHTASIKPCHNCGAMGMIPCFRCHGRGAVRCSPCNGRGHKRTHRGGDWHDERCTWCHGRGRRRCSTCHGCGLVTCTLCLGNRNLKCYIKLTILWKDHLTDHIVERTELPDHLIRTVSGQTAFEEVQPRVWPINHFPDEEVNSASRTLVGQHAQAYPTERMHQQRHRVRIVPVSQIFYTWNDKQLDFFVYGFEHKVYAPTYPQQCCCGCSIL